MGLFFFFINKGDIYLSNTSEYVKKMKKFSTTVLKIAGLGSISIAWMFVVIQVLLGALSFPAFGFFT